MNLDLTEATETAARAYWDDHCRRLASFPGGFRESPWDEISDADRESVVSYASMILTVAAPLIAAQVAEQIAAAIEASVGHGVGRAHRQWGIAAAALAREALR